MAVNVSLDPEIVAKLGVTSVVRTKKGAQKYVFIVDIQGTYRALKVFVTGFGDRERRELEFYRGHPTAIGIPRVVDVFDHAGHTVVLEEYIEGSDLQDIASSYQNNEVEVSGLLLSAIDVMSPFWAENLVHRDLKPQNIIVGPGGRPTVIDFGILGGSGLTDLTVTGFQPHTLMYAAPELLRGDKANVSYRTDFFSLGVIGYYLVSGRHPYGVTQPEILDSFARRVMPPDISRWPLLTTFLQQSLEINISARPRSSEHLRGLLK